MPSRRSTLIGWALCLPALLVFGIFYIGPALVGLYVSFFRWNGSSPHMLFVGFANYLSVLTDARFLHACGVTALVLVAMLFIKLPLALILAAGLSSQNWINRLYRSALFLPYVLSTTVVAMIWIFMFDPYQGLINFGLRSAGLSNWQQGWLGQADTALPSVLVAAVWWTFGLYVVLFTAGMARIPPELYDAIKIETNSRLDVLRHVTVPLLREQIFVACIMTTGGVFGFLTGLFLLMTGGGPAGRTETLGILSYFTAFRALDFGRASTISVIVLVIMSLAVLIPTLRLSRQRLEYMMRAQATQPILAEVRLADVPMRRFPLAEALHYSAYTLAALATLGPVIWIVMLSLKTRREFASHPFALPQELNFGNYLEVFKQDQVPLFVFNSVVTVAAALAIVLVAGTMAAYALARVPFRGRNALFLLFLIGDSLPLIVIIIPLFILVQQLHLSGSRLAIILPYAAMNMGLTVYILRGFFATIGAEIEDAARIDGCNLAQLIWHVILPIARPGLLVVAILNFMSFWNEYFLATVLASSQSLFTLPAGLAATFVNKHATNWPVMAAAVVLTLVPVILVFTLAQDKIVRGWSVSSK